MLSAVLLETLQFHTLLERILELVRPHCFPILSSVPARPSPVLEIFLGLEVIPGPTRAGSSRPAGVQPP